MERLLRMLIPFSWLYGSAMWVRNFLYDRGLIQIQRVTVPVISVGNITAGGTGKTPFVEYLLRYFLRKKMNMAVVSRGYKRKSTGMVLVSDGERILCGADQGGDEPVQIATKFPRTVVIVDKNRSRAARHASTRFRVDGIILDDGFQHRAVARDFDVVMIDARKSLLHTPLLPAGLRREPVSALRRADVLVFSEGTALDEEMSRIRSLAAATCVKTRFLPAAIRRFRGGESLMPGHLRGKKCLAFCGIANPQVFYSGLKRLGMEVMDALTFPDHHTFTVSDWKEIQKRFAGGAEAIVTTEKDAVRLQSSAFVEGISADSLFYVEIETEIVEGESQLHSLIEQIMRRPG